MKHHRAERPKRRLVTVAMAAAACGIIAGFVASSSPEASASSGSETFVAAVPAVPASLDPVSFQAGTRQVLDAYNSQLFNLNVKSCGATPSGLSLTGNLAKSWTRDPGGKSYTITLNDYKSQYGNPLTSEDVKWTVERGLAVVPIDKAIGLLFAHYNPKNPITIINSHTFKLNVVSATPEDLPNFAVPTFTIYDATEAMKHATKTDPWAKAWLATHADGFGPWQITSYTPNSEVVMTPNPGYTGPRGNVSKVILKAVPTPSDQSELLSSGEVDYAGGMTWPEYKSLASSSSVKVYPCAAYSRDWLILNQKYGPLANLKVRQAINMAINRQALVTGAYAGYGTPALTGWIPGEASGGTATESVSAAKALMASAGYPHGFALTLVYNEVQPGPQADQLAILLQSQLSAIGIQLNLDHTPSAATWETDNETGNYQAELYSSLPVIPDVYFDALLIAPGSINNTWHFENPQYLALFKKLSGATPGSQTFNSAATQLGVLNTTLLPVVNLVNTPNIFAMTSNVTLTTASLRTITVLPDFSQLEMK
jgi:peptide/nickel transport system substrate-binding protein